MTRYTGGSPAGRVATRTPAMAPTTAPSGQYVVILGGDVSSTLCKRTNSWSWDHVRWSKERVYMALLMGGAMAVIMLAFMWNMHCNKRLNTAILLAGFLLMGVTLTLSRSQYFVDDREYMKGMIPHHSIAILTSERADIDDVRVCRLADEIIRAKREEVDEMDWLIRDIAKNGEATTPQDAAQRLVPDFSHGGQRAC